MIPTATRTRNGLPEFRPYTRGASRASMRPVVADDYHACYCGSRLSPDRISLLIPQCEDCAPHATQMTGQPGQVHYLAGDDTACHRSTIPLMASADPALVTCGICERTRAYRTARDQTRSTTP